MDIQTAALAALTKMNCDLSDCGKDKILRCFLPDSLALVRFIVEIEQIVGQEIPFGSFDISLLDKPLPEVGRLIQSMLEERKK